MELTTPRTAEPFNVHVEFQPSIDLPQLRQQVYFRVICGKASFFQRALVLMSVDASIPRRSCRTSGPTSCSVAVVKRNRPDIVVADGQLEVFEKFERDALPRLRRQRTETKG
jgi:hypothetical protein